MKPSESSGQGLWPGGELELLSVKRAVANVDGTSPDQARKRNGLQTRWAIVGHSPDK